MPKPDRTDEHHPTGSARTLTRTGSGLLPFPKPAAIAIGVAMLAGIPADQRQELGQVVLLVAMVVAALGCCAIATWAESRLYRGLMGLSGAKRVALTLLAPVIVMGVAWPLALIGSAIVLAIDDGVLLVGVLFGGAWFASASFGSIVMVTIDVVVSALVPDFRSRVQAAVLSLLAITAGFVWLVMRAARATAHALHDAAARDPENVPDIVLGPDTISGDAAVALLTAPETEQFAANAVVFFAVVLALPALLSACGKLADGAMELLNPLAAAIDAVEGGDLNVRVEEGGSREFVRITQGFNKMVGSLTSTLRDLDEKNATLTETNAASSRFVPFQFLELLDKQTIVDIQRGDQTQLDMSVMFADIRGFTTTAERLGPEATFRFINRFLAHMEPAIHKEGGFINAYMGDGIMALFVAGADAAVRAALAMLRALDDLNAALRDEGEPAVRVGIGINSGTLMLGTIGGSDRLSCTVVGDPANLAARVEGMTKLYKTPLLITEATYHRLDNRDGFLLREVDRVRAVGKNEPVGIYEVLRSDVAHRLAYRDTFTEALMAYRAGKLGRAREAFARCADVDPDDPVVALYLDRCDEHEGTADDWDGVTRLFSK